MPRPYDLTLASSDYAPWTGPPTRTLLICTQPRSGSTLLGEALYGAGGLGCPLEYFHPPFRRAFERRWGTGDLATYTAALLNLRTDPTGVFAVKFFWADVVQLVRELGEPTLGDALDADPSAVHASVYRRAGEALKRLGSNPVVVFLTRRDGIGQAISLARAARSGRWRRYADRSVPDEAPTSCDFDDVVQALAAIQRGNDHWRRYLEANPMPCFALEYEELANAYDATVQRLVAWLGHPAAAIPAPRLQAQADARSDQIRRHFLDEFHRRSRGMNG